jgi:hypothetical protein
LRGVFITRDKKSSQVKKTIRVDEKRLTELSKLYNSGYSYRDLMQLGFLRVEYNKAKQYNYFKPRTYSESMSNRIKHKGANVMGNKAREELSKQQSIKNRGGKSKWFEVTGQKVQGTWERNIALKFEELGIKWLKLKTNK